MAPNPFIRYMTSLMYLSKFNGLSRINYPDSEFMQKIRFDRLPGVKPLFSTTPGIWIITNSHSSQIAR